MHVIRFISFITILSSFTMQAYQSLISLTSSTTRGAQSPLEVINTYAKDKAVVLFYKPSCPYCIYMDAKFKALAHQNSNKAQFIMIDIKQHDQAYKAAYGFSTVPTVVYLKKGSVVARHGSENKTVSVPDMQKKVDLLA